MYLIPASDAVTFIFCRATKDVFPIFISTAKRKWALILSLFSCEKCQTFLTALL